MRFKPNDRVEIVVDHDRLKDIRGKHGTITSGCMRDDEYKRTYGYDGVYHCKTDDGDYMHGAAPCFRLLYDGYKVVSWDDCLWIPERMEIV